jgi:hypothetical protein
VNLLPVRDAGERRVLPADEHAGVQLTCPVSSDQLLLENSARWALH